MRKLGSGYQVIGTGPDAVVQVMPGEFTSDAIKVVEYAMNTNGRVTTTSLVDNFGWNKLRAQTILDDLTQNGKLWIDQGPNEVSYWFPAVFTL